jgi:hypothetical protein
MENNDLGRKKAIRVILWKKNISPLYLLPVNNIKSNDAFKIILG